jgi:hypothetical protein
MQDKDDALFESIFACARVFEGLLRTQYAGASPILVQSCFRRAKEGSFALFYRLSRVRVDRRRKGGNTGQR